MEKQQMKKKEEPKKATLMSELNNSLYHLAAYLSEYTTALRETSKTTSAQ